jgi:hypothetical protein
MTKPGHMLPLPSLTQWSVAFMALFSAMVEHVLCEAAVDSFCLWMSQALEKDLVPGKSSVNISG